MSTPKLKLISHKLCPYVQRARIVLDEKAIEHEIEFIDLNNKPQWFLDISPLGKVPVLLVDDKPVFESAVIAEYLDEITPGSLLPSDALQKATHRSWIEFASNTLATIAGLYSASSETAFNASITLLRSRFLTLEMQLGSGPYFGGSDFSLVDAAFGPVFRYFDVIDLYLDLGIFDATPKVRQWRDALSRRPSVERAVVCDYPQRLHRFFAERESYLSRIIAKGRAA